MTASRYSGDRLRAGARHLAALLDRYADGEFRDLENDGGAHAAERSRLEPAIRCFLDGKKRRRFHKEALAVIAWKMWIRKSTAEVSALLDLANKVQLLRGRSELWSNDTQRRALLGQVWMQLPSEAPVARGQPKKVVTYVNDLYRLLSGRVPAPDRGVRPEDEALLRGAYASAWVELNRSREFVEVPPFEEYLPKTNTG